MNNNRLDGDKARSRTVRSCLSVEFLKHFGRLKISVPKPRAEVSWGARHLLALALILYLFVVPGAARAANAPADWLGYYTMATQRDLAGTKLTQIPPAALNDLIIAHLQPWAKAKMEATDGVAEDTGGVCLPTGPFRFANNAGRFLLLPMRDRVVLVFGVINTAGVRRIYLDAKHPRNLLPTWNGHSIGRWEGSTLLVDTVGFNSKSWLMTAMQPHTEETHMTERMRLVEGGKFLENVVVMEDRQALRSAYTFTRYYKRQDAEMEESVCNEDHEVWKKYRDEALQKQLDRARQVK
jgi:hypothetical protein